MGTSDEITRLREGAMLDYDMQTWEVTNHETYRDASWPLDEWTLESGTEIRFLEHEYDDGDIFRISAPADITEVSVEGTPFLSAVRGEKAPGTLTYQGEEYVLAEEDARVDTQPGRSELELVRSNEDYKIMGVCGGIAAYAGVPSSFVRIGFVAATFGVNFIFPCLLMPVVVAAYGGLAFAIPDEDEVVSEGRLSHYWVYQKDNAFVACECTGSNDWDVYAGEIVDPYEFNNILPRGGGD